MVIDDLHATSEFTRKNGLGKLKSLMLCFGTLSKYEREFPRNLMIRNNKTEAVQLFGWALKLILKSSVPIAWVSVQFYCVYKSNRSFSHDILSNFMTFSQLRLSSPIRSDTKKIREKLINESKRQRKTRQLSLQPKQGTESIAIAVGDAVI